MSYTKNTKNVHTVRSPLNIFLMGDLGSGKGTQSELLAKKFKLYKIDMGEEQEKQRKHDKQLDKIFRQTADMGAMSPTAVYRQLVTSAIKNVPGTQGIIFAGHPKMSREVHFVHKLLKEQHRQNAICIYISIPWKETIKRNLARAGYFGSKKRADDSLKAINKRKRFSQAHLIKSKPIYKSFYPFKQISGMGTVEVVHKRVLAAIKELAKLKIENRQFKIDSSL